MATKKCGICRLELDLGKFSPLKSGLLGVRPDCKSCRNRGLRQITRDRPPKPPKPIPATKSCTSCGQTLLIAEFHTRKDMRGQRVPVASCKGCAKKKYQEPEIKKRILAYSRSRKARIRDLKVLRLYGLPIGWYDSQFKAQNGVCKICKRPSNRQLDVDHDHVTGKVRGLLCSPCNNMLGRAQDNPEILRQGAIYLEQHSNSEVSHALSRG